MTSYFLLPSQSGGYFNFERKRKKVGIVGFVNYFFLFYVIQSFNGSSQTYKIPCLSLAQSSILSRIAFLASDGARPALPTRLLPTPLVSKKGVVLSTYRGCFMRITRDCVANLKRSNKSIDGQDFNDEQIRFPNS